MRICHLCGNQVEDNQVCQPCVDDWPNLPDPERMSGHQRAVEMRLLGGPLEVPFPMLHKRIEALVGRGVWTHEMGASNYDTLVREARDRAPRPAR